MNTNNNIPSIDSLRKFVPSEERIKEIVEFFNKNNKVPTGHVTCTVSGRDITLFGPNMERRLQTYGSLENILRKIIHKDVIRELKAKGIVLDLPSSRSGFQRKPKTAADVQAQIEALQKLQGELKAKEAAPVAEVKADPTPAPAPAAKAPAQPEAKAPAKAGK